MQIHKYEKNQSEVDKRKLLKPFGNANKIKIKEKDTNFAFILNTDKKLEVKEEKEEVQEAYKPNIILKKQEEVIEKTDNYTPPVTIIKKESVSVKISNYDMNMKREELYKILTQYSKVKFERFHMVHDKETGKSRGYSYVSLSSKEKAVQFMSDLKIVVIDNLRLCVEIAKNK